MAYSVQSYDYELATAVEFSNDMGDNGFYGAAQPSPNWPMHGGVGLDFLPTEDECNSGPSYYQEQEPRQPSTVPETKPAAASLFLLPGKAWWDESELAPSIYKTLKERERSKLDYRSPQLLSR